MKKFAKAVLALVLAVALVLPLMPVAEAKTAKEVQDTAGFENFTKEAKLKAYNDALKEEEYKKTVAEHKVKETKDAVAEAEKNLETVKKAKIEADDSKRKPDEYKDETEKNNAILEAVKAVDKAKEDQSTAEKDLKDQQQVVKDLEEEIKKLNGKPDDEDKPGKIDGYYEMRPYFVLGKNACEMLRDWDDDDKVQDLLDDLNEEAQEHGVYRVPDVDVAKEHMSMKRYEDIADDYNDEYGYVEFKFEKAISMKDMKYTGWDPEYVGTVFQSRIAKDANELTNLADSKDTQLHNNVYYIPVKVDYTSKKYSVSWKIVPNQTSLEKAMGYWPGRDLTEKYDDVVDGNPFDAKLWEIENIGKVDPCDPTGDIPFPLPDMRINDKGGLWFYAPTVAPKAVKVKDSDPAKYEVTFEYIFAGTDEYEKLVKGNKPEDKVEKPADKTVVAKTDSNKSNNPGTGDVMVLSYLVSGVAAAGAYVATKHNR